MPHISAFYGVVITMYFRDHPPPHFHARYGEHVAEIAVGTLTVIDGWLPPRALRLVGEWAGEHRDELQANWDRARAHEALVSIDPLPSIPAMVAVTAVEPLTDYTLHLTFDDGSVRVIDLADELWGPMGEPLRDPAYFRQVRVDLELRTIVWPNGFDLDPDVLHGRYPPERPPAASRPSA